jgi:phage terminase large subunit-like protein
MKKPETRGDKVCRFIEEFCRAPEGKHVGQPIVLEDFQREFIHAVYDNPQGTRRGYLSIARKNGKTALIAGILLSHICGPEAKLNTQIVSGALSREQAAIVFALAVKMIRMHPRLEKACRIMPSAKSIIGLARNVEFRALSAEGKTAHGLSPVLAILDEVGQVRGTHSDFIDAIVTSQGAHSAPLLLAISTQAPNDADLFSVWLDDAANSCDPLIVSRLYAAPKDCALDDKAAWLTANPAMGKFRSLDDLVESADRASRMPSFEPTFRNLMLNQRVEMVAPFISRSIWLLNSQDPADEAFTTCPVFVGLDLSAKTDLTAMVMIAQMDKRWHVRAHFWTPEKGLKDRAKRDRAPYDIWAEQGLIHTTPGAAIQYDVVARDIAEILAECDVQAVAFDRWRFDLLRKEFDELGIELPLLPFGQGFKDMAPAVDSLESRLLNDELAHGAHPVLTMCMFNSRVEKDAAGNRKLNKAKSTGRIDGAVALAMATGVSVANLEHNDIEQGFVLL